MRSIHFFLALLELGSSGLFEFDEQGNISIGKQGKEKTG